MSIEIIDESSPFLTEVKKLWRKNSDTLGFFPEGAFAEHAAKKSVIIAVSAQKDIMGYLLYRTVKRGAGWPIAVIVHLCVANNHRGRGVAKNLVESLRKMTSYNFLRVELKCRRDFEANKMWPHIGFTYDGDDIGRAGLPLGRWYMAFRDLPLMALFRQKDLAKKFLAVIDSNILFRLQDPVVATAPAHERILCEEAKALLEGWLDEDVTLAITNETLNEIERQNNYDERQRRRLFSKEFHRIESSQDKLEKVYERLEAYFTGTPTDNLKSDIVQVSQAIAGNAFCLITQDLGLIKRADLVEREFGIKIMAPGEFVGHVDEVIREVQYCPKALGGSRRLMKSTIHGRLPPNIYSQFRYSPLGERKNEFEAQLRVFMAQPSRYVLELCSQSSGNHMVFIVYDRGSRGELAIPVLRIASSPFAQTVLRYVLRQIILTSFHEKCVITTIGDRSCGDRFSEALEEAGFSKIDGHWVKCNLPFAGDSEDLRAVLETQSDGVVLRNICSALSAAMQTGDPIALVDIERRLWPAKILDANIPNYIISIKSGWAQHLFDEDLAAQTLYGAREEIALKHENVYYRRYRYPAQVRGPARILWYVMKDHRYRNSMQLKACSFLDEVVTGKAKDLFKRFQRLGIYEWTDILRDAQKKPDNPLMALCFSNTEVFPHPIDLQSFTGIVKREDDKSLCLQSPQVISAKSFAILYKAGMGIS
jgi:predicted nucleic acid-binding protein